MQKLNLISLVVLMQNFICNKLKQSPFCLINFHFMCLNRVRLSILMAYLNIYSFQFLSIKYIKRNLFVKTELIWFI